MEEEQPVAVVSPAARLRNQVSCTLGQDDVLAVTQAVALLSRIAAKMPEVEPDREDDDHMVVIAGDLVPLREVLAAWPLSEATFWRRFREAHFITYERPGYGHATFLRHEDAERLLQTGSPRTRGRRRERDEQVTEARAA
jgi:hypothetical protein